MQNKGCSVLRFLSLVFRPSPKRTRALLKTPAWEANFYVFIFNSYGGSAACASRTLRYKHYKHNLLSSYFGVKNTVRYTEDFSRDMEVH